MGVQWVHVSKAQGLKRCGQGLVRNCATQKVPEGYEMTDRQTNINKQTNYARITVRFVVVVNGSFRQQ